MLPVGAAGPVDMIAAANDFQARNQSRYRSEVGITIPTELIVRADEVLD